MKDLDSSMKEGLLWGWVITVLNAIVQILVLAVLARYLSPTEFGVVGLGNIVTAFSMLVLEMGVAAALTQKENINNQHKGSAHFISLLASLIVGLCIILFSKSISIFFNSEELQNILPLYAAIFMVRGFGIVAQGLVLRDLRFKDYNFMEFISYFLGYGLTGIGLSLLGFGVWSLVLGYFTQAVIKTILLNRYIENKSDWKLSKTGISGVLSFGIGDTIGQSANFFANQLDNILIGKLIGVFALGIYGRAYQISVMPVNLIGNVMQRTLFPVFSRANRDNICDFIIPWLRLTMFVGVYISLSLAFWAHEIVNIILGEQWIKYSRIFEILAYGIFFRLIMKFSDSFLRSQAKLYRRAVVQIIFACGVFSAILLSYTKGLEAVCFSILYVLILVSILSFCLVGFSIKIGFERILSLLTAPIYSSAIFLFTYMTIGSLKQESPIINLTLYCLLSLSIIGIYSSFIRRYFKKSSSYV